jgi:hypothetical protein
MWTVSLLACGLSTATNSTPESIRAPTADRACFPRGRGRGGGHGGYQTSQFCQAGPWIHGGTQIHSLNKT